MMQDEALGTIRRRARYGVGSRPHATFLAFLFFMAFNSAGCASLHFLLPRGGGGDSAPPDVRFVTRDDLLLHDGPVQLDVVFTLHPGMDLDPARMSWQKRGRDARLEPREIFSTLTGNVMAKAFRSAIEVAPGGHSRLEELRRILTAQGSCELALPPFKAKALVLVDFRPCRPGASARSGQLLVQVFDISFPRYEELSLFSPRLLVFEDYAEVRVPESPAQFAGTLVLAWREILSRLGQSDRFRRYLASGAGPLSRDGEENAVLFGLIPPERIARRPDPAGHEWIEKTILFPPAWRPEPPPPIVAPPAVSPAGSQPSADTPPDTPPDIPAASPPDALPERPGPIFSDVAPATPEASPPGSDGANGNGEEPRPYPGASQPDSASQEGGAVEGSRAIGEPEETPGLPPEAGADGPREGR